METRKLSELWQIILTDYKKAIDKNRFEEITLYLTSVSELSKDERRIIWDDFNKGLNSDGLSFDIWQEEPIWPEKDSASRIEFMENRIRHLTEKGF